MGREMDKCYMHENETQKHNANKLLIFHQPVYERERVSIVGRVFLTLCYLESRWKVALRWHNAHEIFIGTRLVPFTNTVLSTLTKMGY